MTLIHSGSGPSRADCSASDDERVVVTAASRAVLPEWISAEPWQIAPAETYRLAAWLRVRDLWLEAIYRRCESVRSAREYARVWTDFYGGRHNYTLPPWNVTPTDAQEWVTESAQRLAPATVNKAVAIHCSYFKFASGQFMPDRTRLFDGVNPFDDQHLLSTVSKFGRAKYPTVEQVLDICAQIDTSSPAGLRDLCLIRGMFVTTRRLNEWLRLQWCDISGDIFSCRLKGGRDNRQILPDGLKGEITAWLHAAGNWPPRPDDYLFVRFPRPTWERPLHPGNVWRMLRHYGRLADVPEELCHPHGLRHAGARYRRQHGATAFELQQILGHRSIRTTEIYIDEVLKNPEDRLGNAVDSLFARARAQPSRAYVRFCVAGRRDDAGRRADRRAGQVAYRPDGAVWRNGHPADHRLDDPRRPGPPAAIAPALRGIAPADRRDAAMSTPAKAGGYLDRDHLERAIRANTEMTQIILQVTQGNIPPALSIPLMRFSALLAGQLTHLRDMRAIRKENNGNA